MPVLLAPDQAPTLRELLAQANTAGQPLEIAPGTGPEPRIRGIGSLESAGPDEISFLSNPKLREQLDDCGAAAVIVTPDVHDAMRPELRERLFVVRCEQPYLMFALLAQWFDQHRLARLTGGIHPSAVIADDAVIGAGVAIGPHCVIESGASIGDGCRLGPGCVIGAGASIGKHGLLHARVTLYHGVVVGDRAILHTGVVLGADGFGFAPDPRGTGGWVKIAQIGGVRVGNDVEIGANTTVDRGALNDTVLGDGVKLDNQIMLGHNVQVGDHTAIAGCVGVAGSAVIGKRCMIGGAASISGHLSIADDVVVSGGTAITANVDAPGRYSGVYPFALHQEWQRNAAVLSQLGQLRRRLRALERSAAEPSANGQD